MVEKNKKRRKALRSIVAGGGAVVAARSVPDLWSKPIVDAVLLPAHAETTDDSAASGEEQVPTTTTTTTTTAAPEPLDYYGLNLPMTRLQVENTRLKEGQLIAGVIDALIPVAHARSSSDIDMSVSVSGSSTTVRFTNGQRDAVFNVAAPINGSPSGKPNLEGGACAPTKGPQSVQINGYTSGDNSMEVQVNGGNGSWKVTVDKGPIGTISATCAISDRRFKTQIERVGTSNQGFKLYTFKYLADTQKRAFVGVMAQDLIASHPQALVTKEDGSFMVRYDRLGLRMVSLEEWENKGPGSVERVH